MSIANVLYKLPFLSEGKILELYPPFFFMGVKFTKISDDYTRLVAHLPLRWYAKNLHGTMFGGSMCALSDPLHTLLCSKLFQPVEAWTQANHVEFLRPAKSDLKYEALITDEDIQQIRHDLKKNGKTVYTFVAYFVDTKNRKIARVENSVFLRKKHA